MDSCRLHTAPPHLLLSVPGNRSSRRRSAAAAVAAAAEVEIRVCVNRSCGRQGSREVLEVLSGLAPPAVTVVSCGCLGRCGTGPNLVVLPRAAVVGHCGTPARAAQLLAELCGPGFDPGRNLEALALRRKGEDEVHKGNPSGAQAILSQAIDLQPSGGRHFIYKARSAARLAIGDRVGALEDAEEACRIAPKYTQAYISQGDAFMAMEELKAAENAYSSALQVDPSIRRSKSFKARIMKLNEKLITSNVSS